MSERNYKVFTEMIRNLTESCSWSPDRKRQDHDASCGASLHQQTETKIWTLKIPWKSPRKDFASAGSRRSGLTLPTAMRSFLQGRPDVIMVGEMRDHETWFTGIEASLTGHLVFSTLHTNSAPETITRLLDMGMDPFNLQTPCLESLPASGENLCKECKQSYHPSREEYDTLVRSYAGDFDAVGLSTTPTLFSTDLKAVRSVETPDTRAEPESMKSLSGQTR